MRKLIHTDDCVIDPDETPPRMMVCLQAVSDTATRLTAWEECVGCTGRVTYAAGGTYRGSRLITHFRREAVPWIATWMTRNTVWGDQPIPGL